MNFWERLSDYYAATYEPWIDNLSSAEANLFDSAVGAFFLFMIWFFREIYKHCKKPPAPPLTETAEEQAPAPSGNSLETTAKPLPHTSHSQLFGRKKELKMLTDAWHDPHKNIVVLKAMGGTGKTRAIGLKSA